MAERIQIEPVSGFPEWLPNLRLQEERFLATIRDRYQLFGFTPIETPAIERMEVLTAKGGMHRQIYTVGRPEEGGSDTSMGLHFDLTVPLARYVALYAEKLTFPFRRYQIQKVWRGERAQRGRFREFYQCDVDIVGRTSLDPIHDAEIPCVINATFEAMALPEFQVHMSNRKVLEDLLKTKEVGPSQMVQVLRAIDKTDRAGAAATRKVLAAEQVDAELIPAVMDLIEAPTVEDARQVLTRAGAAMDGLSELENVLNGAIALGMPPSRIRPNFAIARGLDYYTGTIYETRVLGKEEWGSICSGGRYDDLASFFTNQKFPGVGISIGLTRLFDLLVKSELVPLDRKSPTQVLVTMQDRSKYMNDYLGLAQSLRAAGVPTEVFLEPSHLGKQIGYAASNGIPLAVIAGDSEVAQGVVKVRDLRTRSEESVARADLAAHVRAKLGI